MSTISASTTTTTAYKVTADTTGVLTFQTGATPTTAVTINGSQNVGIGTSSPTTKLQFGTSEDSLSWASGNGIIECPSTLYLRSTGAGNVTFQTNGSERARIDSSGNLLVGTTTSGGVGFSLTSNAGAICTTTQRANGTGATNMCLYVNPNGTVGTIQISGSSTSYNTSSDYRLKNTVAPMTGALARVAALKPVTYKWNADDSEGEGFIAHELAEVCPHAVTGEKDAVESYTDEEGNEQTRPVYQGIDVSFLVATLTAAIQELKAELDAVKAQLQGAA